MWRVRWRQCDASPSRFSIFKFAHIREAFFFSGGQYTHNVVDPQYNPYINHGFFILTEICILKLRIYCPLTVTGLCVIMYLYTKASSALSESSGVKSNVSGCSGASKLTSNCTLGIQNNYYLFVEICKHHFIISVS